MPPGGGDGAGGADDGSDGTTGDGSTGEDGADGDSSTGTDGPTGDGSTGDDGSTDDGSTDGDGSTDTGGDGGTDTDTGTEPPPSGPIPAGMFCDALSTVMCEAEQDCCTQMDWMHADADACITAQVPDCESNLQELIDDARTGYDPERARMVIDDLKSKVASCDDTISGWFVSRSTGLLSIFEGTVEAMGDCSPADGDDGGAILSCTDGNACRVTPLGPTNLNGECGAPKTEGTQCVTHFECQEDLWCTAPMNNVGDCAQRKSNGQSCDETIECTSFQCEEGSCVEATVDLVYCSNR